MASSTSTYDNTLLDEQINAANDLRFEVTREYVALIHKRLTLRLTAALPEGGTLVTETYSEVGETDVSVRRIERLNGSSMETDGGDDEPETFFDPQVWESLVEDLRTLLWYGAGVYWRRGEERFDFPAAQTVSP